MSTFPPSFTDIYHFLSFAVLAVLLFLAYQQAISRSINPPNSLILHWVTLVAEREKMQIMKNATRRRVDAVRQCENRVYTRITRITESAGPSSEVGADAEGLRYISRLREHLANIDRDEERKLEELRERSTKKSEDQQRVNARIRLAEKCFVVPIALALAAVGTVTFFTATGLAIPG